MHPLCINPRFPAHTTPYCLFGIHRFYIGKWVTGLLYLLTGGGLFIGVIYDFCRLNAQISELNAEKRP